MSEDTTTPVSTVTPLPAMNPMGVEAQRLRSLLLDNGINPDTGESLKPNPTVFSVDPLPAMNPEESDMDMGAELPVITDLIARVEYLERKQRGE